MLIKLKKNHNLKNLKNIFDVDDKGGLHLDCLTSGPPFSAQSLKNAVTSRRHSQWARVTTKVVYVREIQSAHMFFLMVAWKAIATWVLSQGIFSKGID